MTRAEKQAFLSFASTRFRYGNMQYNEPSRFISEIDASLIDSPQVQKIEKRELTTKPGYSLSNHVKRRKLVKPEANAGSVSNADMADLIIGAKVRHDRFGRGEIVGLEGEPPNRKATVEFQNIGKKQLLLKFAKLQIID